MKINAEVSGHDFPLLFERFENTIDRDLWHKRARDIRSEIRGNPYLKDYLQLENRFALVLDGYSAYKERHRTAPVVNILDPWQYDAVALVTQFVRLTETADAATARALIARMRGSIKNPPDLYALALELETATQLQRAGASIHLPQGGTYDWLAQRDGLSFEVECKSISYDKGRQVHFRASLVTNHLIKKALGKSIDGLSNGLLVRIRVPKRFPDSYHERQQIAALVKQAVLSAKDLRESFASVSLQHFAASLMPDNVRRSDPSGLRQFLDTQFGIKLQHAMALGTRGNGVLLLVNESETPDDVIGETMNTLRDAARNQLSGTRPSVLCAKLEGSTAADLTEIASESAGRPSALRIRVNRLFESSALENVVWIIFLADGNVEAKTGAYSRSSAAYGFWNPSSPVKDDVRLRIFGLSKQLSQVDRE